MTTPALASIASVARGGIVDETLFRQLVRARHWTTYPAFLTQFGNAARLVAARERDPRLATLSVSQKTFKRWLAGQVLTQPRPDVARVLEDMFDRPVRALFHPPAPLERGTDSTADGPPELNVRKAAQRALRFSALAQSGEAPADALEQLGREARRLARVYALEPLPRFLGDLTNLQDLAFTLLEGRYRPDQARDLHLAAAIVSGLMARASIDVADFPAALTQAHAALLCAQRAGHGALAAKIISWQALAAHWHGWTQQAIDYARQGASLGTHGYVSIYLPSQEARTHALAGDHARALDALRRARQAHEDYQGTDIDALGGMFIFPPCRQAAYWAETLVLLGPADKQAIQAADEAVAAIAAASPEERYFSNEAGALIHQAIARIAHGDADGAYESLEPVLGLPAGHRNHDLTVMAMRAHRQLGSLGPRVPGFVRELQERIELFSNTGPGALNRLPTWHSSNHGLRNEPPQPQPVPPR